MARELPPQLYLQPAPQLSSRVASLRFFFFQQLASRRVLEGFERACGCFCGALGSQMWTGGLEKQ